MARAWTSVRDSKWEARRPEAVASQRGRSEKFAGGVALGSYARRVSSCVALGRCSVLQSGWWKTYEVRNGLLQSLVVVIRAFPLECLFFRFGRRPFQLCFCFGGHFRYKLQIGCGSML